MLTMVNAGILMKLKLVDHTKKSRIGQSGGCGFVIAQVTDYFFAACTAFGYLMVISLSKLSAWSTSFITHSR
ncbi:hypothetical protein RCH05_003030 [Janthinobacterium sp. CAN_S7]